MEGIRIGIIGLGNMGTGHARKFYTGEIEGAVLSALCDARPERLEWAKGEFPEGVEMFTSIDEFYEKANIDGVIIVTPHYSHPELSIRAFEKGWHVMCEKPAGVYTKQVRLMNEAAERSGKVFSLMFNQRTNPLFQQVKELIEQGELGEIRRTNWIITDWYRSQCYYDSASWRATWAGEGGGVLLNQAPHQLDLWQWVTGMMPVRVRAFCGFGKRRNIEVEDEVTAYVEYENGATGVFVTTVTEAPGTNRFEIVGDKGKIVIENQEAKFFKLTTPENEFNLENDQAFARPAFEEIILPFENKQSGHLIVFQNWVATILKKEKLIAPGIEGINSLMISNAIYLSAWTNQTVELPIDEDIFLEKLQEKIDEAKVVN